MRDCLNMADQLEGRNPVLEAIKSNKTILEIWLAGGMKGKAVQEIVALARKKRIPIKESDKETLNRMAQSRNHQGVVAKVEPYQYGDFDDIIDEAIRTKENPLIILLDGIEDPHNLGSIIRSAEVFGASAVVIPKKRAVGVTPAVARIASGALEHVPVIQVVNMTEAIKSMKNKNFWIAGGDGEGSQEAYGQNLKGPMGLVIGSEGKGVSRLVKENCDYLIRIPMAGKTGSLNASVAAGILLYEVFSQNHRIKETTR